jgi:hypothetical protein
MIKFKNLTKYHGLFENCHMEPTTYGFSLFDKNNEFVGEILDEGFSLNGEYEYRDHIEREVTKKGIPVFDFSTKEEIDNEKEIAEALYG